MTKPGNLPRRAGEPHVHSVRPDIITPFTGSFLPRGGVTGNIFEHQYELALTASLFSVLCQHTHTPPPYKSVDCPNIDQLYLHQRNQFNQSLPDIYTIHWISISSVMKLWHSASSFYYYYYFFAAHTGISMTQKEPRAQCTSIWSHTGPEAGTGEDRSGFLLEEPRFLPSVPFTQQQEKLTRSLLRPRPGSRPTHSSSSSSSLLLLNPSDPL